MGSASVCLLDDGVDGRTSFLDQAAIGQAVASSSKVRFSPAVVGRSTPPTVH